MRSIKIIAVPPGQAPLEIREKWIGVVIPLAEDKIKGVQAGVKGGPAQNGNGHTVNIAAAVDALQKSSVEAAKWWRSNLNFTTTPQLVFAKNVCELVD